MVRANLDRAARVAALLVFVQQRNQSPEARVSMQSEWRLATTDWSLGHVPLTPGPFLQQWKTREENRDGSENLPGKKRTQTMLVWDLPKIFLIQFG